MLFNSSISHQAQLLLKGRTAVSILERFVVRVAAVDADDLCTFGQQQPMTLTEWSVSGYRTTKDSGSYWTTPGALIASGLSDGGR